MTPSIDWAAKGAAELDDSGSSFLAASTVVFVNAGGSTHRSRAQQSAHSSGSGMVTRMRRSTATPSGRTRARWSQTTTATTSLALFLFSFICCLSFIMPSAVLALNSHPIHANHPAAAPQQQQDVPHLAGFDSSPALAAGQAVAAKAKAAAQFVGAAGSGQAEAASSSAVSAASPAKGLGSNGDDSGRLAARAASVPRKGAVGGSGGIGSALLSFFVDSRHDKAFLPQQEELEEAEPETWSRKLLYTFLKPRPAALSHFRSSSTSPPHPTGSPSFFSFLFGRPAPAAAPSTGKGGMHAAVKTARSSKGLKGFLSRVISKMVLDPSDPGSWLLFVGILIGILFAVWTNPNDTSFQAFLTDLTIRVRLKAMQEVGDDGNLASGKVGMTPAASASSPHVLSFANHLSLSVQLPPFRRLDYGIFSIVSVPRRRSRTKTSRPPGANVSTGGSTDAALTGDHQSKSKSPKGKPVVTGTGGGTGGKKKGKMGKKVSHSHIAAHAQAQAHAGPQRRGSVGIDASVRQNSVGDDSLLELGEDAGDGTGVQRRDNAATAQPIVQGLLSSRSAGLAATDDEEAYWFAGILGYWFPGMPGWSDTFLHDVAMMQDPWYQPTKGERVQDDAAWGVMRMAHDFEDVDMTSESLLLSTIGMIPDTGADDEEGDARREPSSAPSRKVANRREASLEDTLPPPAIASHANKARKRKTGKSEAVPTEQHELTVVNRIKYEPAPPAVLSEVASQAETAPITSTESPHSQEQNNLDELLTAVAGSRAAVSELESQLESLQSTNEAARAALQQQLEILRNKKKEEDTVRSDLRGKVKGLEESKRIAEMHRREAERKMKQALAAQEAYQARIQKKQEMIKTLKQKTDACAKREVTSRDEQANKQVEIEQSKKEKEAELQALDVHAQRLWDQQGLLQKQVLAARSGLEQARLRLQQRRAIAFESAVRQASAVVMQQQREQQALQLQQQQQQQEEQQQRHMQIQQHIAPHHAQIFPTGRAVSGPASGSRDTDLTAADFFFDPTANDYPHVGRAPFSHIDSSPVLAAPIAVQPIGFDGRQNGAPVEEEDAMDSFHDAETGNDTDNAAAHFASLGFAPLLNRRESAFYTADPATLMPPTPISPFSTGLLPSNLFQNLDDDAQGNLVSPSHVNSTFARFGIDPVPPSDDDSGLSDMMRQASVDGSEALSEGNTDAKSDAAEDAKEGGKRSRRSVQSRRSWWGKRTSREQTFDSAAADDGNEDAVAAGDSGEDKRRSFNVFPKLSMNPSAKTFRGIGGPVEANGRSISRPIGPLIPLSQGSGPVSSDFEMVRRAFQLPIGAEDDESGRNSWSAFDHWQANEGARRAMLHAALANNSNGHLPNSNVGYDPRFSTDSLPLNLANRNAAGANWQHHSNGMLPLDRTTSAEISSDAASSASRGRTVSSRLAFWANTDKRKSVSPTRPFATDTDADADAELEPDTHLGSELSTSPQMPRTPSSKRRFWNRRSDVTNLSDQAE